jgi:hypothetical protein
LVATAAIFTTGIVAGTLYGAHVSPAPFSTPYRLYIASSSSTSSDVCRESRKYRLPSATTSWRISSSRFARASASVKQAGAGTGAATGPRRPRTPPAPGGGVTGSVAGAADAHGSGSTRSCFASRRAAMCRCAHSRGR